MTSNKPIIVRICTVTPSFIVGMSISLGHGINKSLSNWIRHPLQAAWVSFSVGWIAMMPLFIFGFIIMGIIRTTGDYGVQINQYAFGIIDNNDWHRVIIFIRSISEYALAT